MASQIQIRRDTATNWASINPILAQGEFGYVLDSQEFKIKKGDGITAWNSLQFIEFGDKALWGNIGGDITNQPDLMNYLQNLQSDIDDEVSARESADQTLINQYNSLNTSVSNIQAVIPNDATAQNQLADKSFVNSSIASSTANFIGTFNSVAEMEAYSGPLTNNDYAFVETTDSAGNTLYDRYKWNGTEWLFEYELNNSSFTADQWAAINSNATDSKVAQITTNATNITTLQGQVAGKQDTITDLATIRSNAQAGKSASDTIATYGNIVTHNVSEFATSTQGAKADSAIQGVQVNGTALIKDVNNSVNVILGTAAFASTADFATAAQGSKADTAVQLSDLATVATSGSYNDLNNKPTIPTINSSNNYVPYRSSASAFGNSTLMYNSNAMAFTGRLHIGSSSPGTYYNKGRLSIYDNTPSTQVSSLALLNYGGGGGCGVAIDMYNTSANSNIPSGRIGLIDNGSYSGYLQLQVKKSGAQGNPLLPAMNVVPMPATNSLTTCISFGQDEFNRVLFDLHKPESSCNVTDASSRFSGSGTTYSVQGANKFSPRLMVAVGDIVSFDNFSTEANVIGIVSDSTTFQITTDKTLGNVSNSNISVKKAYFKVTDENYNVKTYIDPNGKLGINTLTPEYELDVNGTINATTVLQNGQPISGGSSLPDQTGQSGKYLTTDGTDASWGEINALQNTATGLYSLSILGDTGANTGSIAIGARSRVTSYNSIALGFETQANILGTAIGYNSKTCNGDNQIAIGANAISYNTGAYQIGAGTNLENNTLYVGWNGYSSYKLLDGVTGLIPPARFGALPASDGTYTLKLTITNGVPTLEWVAM